MRSLREAWAYIRFRVTVVATTAALAAATVASVLFLMSLHRSLEAGLVSTARQEISAIKAQLADGASPQQVVITGGGDVVIQLLDANGSVVASDHKLTTKRPLRRTPGIANDLRVPGQDDDFTVVAKRIDSAGGVGMVIVGRANEQADRATGVTAALLLVTVPCAVFLLGFIVWMSIGGALRPVEAMRREADAITSAHLGRRLAVPPGHDEIPRLAATLNEMLDRIDRSHRLQRQFVSDASHELRSPLSAIRQSAQVARSYPEHVSKERLADDVLAESHRLENLVSALLLLARLDDSSAPSDDEVVDVDDLVLDEVHRIRSRSGTVQVDVSQVSAGQVHGSAILLAPVVRNLVDNAVRHARSRVCVSLHERDHRVELYVDDDGTGIAEEDRERVFERFVRLDEARNRDVGGSGLGLAIVRTIVEVLGGAVDVGTAPIGGARFSVVLPAAL